MQDHDRWLLSRLLRQLEMLEKEMVALSQPGKLKLEL